MAPCVLLGLGLWKLPYSPRWLVQVGRDQDALQSLVRLRGLPTSDPRLQAEWITIRTEAIMSREIVTRAHPSLQGTSLGSEIKLEAAAWVDMFRGPVIRRTMIGVMLMVFQQFQGINALIYYSPTLFEQLGLDYSMQITMSGVLNVVQMVATCSAFFTLDRLGRRPPLLFGSIGNTISHVIVAIMIARFSGDWANHQGPAWTGVTFILIFMFCFGVGWSPVPWAMPAEVHSSARRAKGVAITTCCNWLFNFIIGLITPPMIQNIRWGTFVFFAAFSFMSGIWVWFICPETKGKTLEDLDLVFNTRAGLEEEHDKVDIVKAICGLSANTSTDSTEVLEAKGDEKDVQEKWVERA
jgi:sugar porter (SP) family MFS transporter